jgi:hypothetical protein
MINKTICNDISMKINIWINYFYLINNNFILNSNTNIKY